MDDNNLLAKEGNEASFKDFFFKYIRFLPFFILSLAVALLIAFMFLRWSSPVYRAQGTLTFKKENSGSNKFDELFGNDKSQDVLTEIEVLKSKPLMQRVVKELNLQTSYYAVGKVKKLNIYKNCPFTIHAVEINPTVNSFSLNILFSDEQHFTINGGSHKFMPGDLFKNQNGTFMLSPVYSGLGGKEYEVRWQSEQSAAAEFASMVAVSPKIVSSTIYNIAIDVTNQQMGVDIINQLMKEYQLLNVEEKNTTTEQALHFIDDRLLVLDSNINSIASDVKAIKKKYGITDIEVQASSSYEAISNAQTATAEQRLNLYRADNIVEYLSDKKYDFDAIPSSLNLSDPTLVALTGQYNSLQFERKGMLDRNIPAANQYVVLITNEIEASRKALLENIKNVKKVYEKIINDEYERASKAKGIVEIIPEAKEQIAEIERDLDVKQGLYKFLLEEKEKISTTQASVVPSSKILDAAVPYGMVSPNKKSIRMLAIILGLGIPSLFVFVLEIINDKIYTRADVEKITGTPILGEIGHSYNSDTMLISRTNRSMVAEQFRIVRSNMQYTLTQAKKPVILVTSSFSGEGKSFISTNLGGVLALAGKKTLILEFDIRKPKILSGLQLKSKVGITNFVVGKCQAEDLPIQIEGFENLYVAGCGPVPPNPSELLLDPKIDELFKWAKENFDVLIIDTAPVGMVSDAMTLGKFADTSLYIIRQGYTHKKQIGLIDEFYRNNRLPKVSVIINDVKMRAGYGYYGYGRYGYGYGYGENGGYYDLEKEEKSAFSRFFSTKRIKKIFKLK